MFQYRWLAKKNLIDLISFIPKDFTFMILHKLLQSIVRSKSNRGKLFNLEIFIRQFIFKRSFRKFRKIKLIRFSIKFSMYLFFPTIYDSTTGIQERSTKNNRTSFTSSCTKYNEINRIQFPPI